MSKFLVWILWLSVSRFNFVFIVVEVVIYTIVGRYYMPTSFIVFILTTYVLIVAMETSFFFYFYLKVKGMESIWDNSSIDRVKRSTLSWSKVQFRQLKVGDLVLLKHGTVAPADLLIIDTSDNHFSEQILNTNERRVTGCNKLTIKRAVKNMRSKNVGRRNPHEAIKTLLSTLEGQVEYEGPSERVAHFTGTFKLNNDPQISKISHKNMLFCGTQLHTTWMMGIVLFTGQQTKIIQMNMLQWTAFQRLRKEIKISRISLLINWVFILYITADVIFAIVFIVQLSLKDNEANVIRFVETFVFGNMHFLAKVLLVWQGSLIYVPHMVVLVYEVTCFVFGIHIQRQKYAEMQEKLERASRSITSVKEFSGRRGQKKKSTRQSLTDTPEGRRSRHTGNNGRTATNTNDTSNILTHDSNKNTLVSTRRRAPRESDRRGGTGRGTVGTGNSGSANSTGVRGSKKTNMENKIMKEDPDQVKVINYEALPDLGGISHVVFDKTDTLTMSTMHVCQVATCEKIYRFEGGEHKLQELMNKYNLNPGEFEFEEDEEEKRAKENSFYSEKSQEYEKEIDGKFHCDIIDESSLDLFDNIEAPTYNLNGNNNFQPKELSAGSGDFSAGGSDSGKIKSQRSDMQYMFTAKQSSGSGAGQTMGEEDDSFAKLGLLEKQFKKAIQLDKEKAKGREKSASAEDSDLDLDLLTRNGLALKVNNDKHMNEMHLVADIRKRSEQLEEFLSYMFVMHQIEYGNHNHEQHYLRPEDEAIFNVVFNLGFVQKGINKQKAAVGTKKNLDEPDVIFSLDFETVAGLKRSCKVHASNIFSQSRGRKSMIISAMSPSENDPYLLVTIGTEKSMRGVMRSFRTKKEDNILKILIAKQKQKGLKIVMVAKKGLSSDQVMHYIKENEKISNSARDQIEDLEHLAIQMEHALEFVGCMGLRDSIKEEAVELADDFSKIGITMSIMSGDELENCMTVVQKLNMSQIDIQNSTSFYWLRGTTEKTIMQEMRRIFDMVHDTLQSDSYNAIDRTLKEDKDEGKDILDSKLSIQRHESHNEDSKEDHGSEANLMIYDQYEQIKKTLLISGDAVEIIMNSENLSKHLSSVYYVSGTIIAYDLRPKHKAFLIDMMRNCGEIVLAIGDGFNDIGMLSRANIGVQISNSNVPLIFGDIVVPHLSQIKPLLLHHGFTIMKNHLLMFVMLTNIVTMGMFYPTVSIYFSYFTISYPVTIGRTFFTNVCFLLFAIFSLFNTASSKTLINMFPSMYQENRIFLANLPNIMMVFFLWSLVEGVAITLVIMKFLSKDLNASGYSATINTTFTFYALITVINTLVKVMLFLSRPTWRQLLALLIPGLAIFAVFVTSNFSNNYNVDVNFLAGSSYYLTSYFHSALILPLILNYFSAIIISYYKRNYFHRSAVYLRSLSREESPDKTNEGLARYLKSLFTLPDDVYLCVIKRIKRPFRDLKSMDSSLRRIINLDFHNSNMGLGRLINTIVDADERKRFTMFQTTSINKSTLTYFLVTMVIVVAIDWNLRANFASGVRYYGFTTTLPYLTLMLIGLIVIKKFASRILRPSIVGTFSTNARRDLDCHDTENNLLLDDAWQQRCNGLHREEVHQLDPSEDTYPMDSGASYHVRNNHHRLVECR